MSGIVHTGGSEQRAREQLQVRFDQGAAPSRHIDLVLVVAAIGLALFGLLVIYSATRGRQEAAGLDPGYFVQRQAVSLGLGLVGMFAVTLVSYRQLRLWSLPLYLLSIVLLVAVLLFGVVRNGSRAWLELPGFQFQPSELAKITLILLLAALFHERREDALGLRALIEALAAAAVPMALILAEPDFGTFMVFVVIVFGVLLLARVRVRILLALVGLGLAAMAALVLSGQLEDYQVDRLTAFVNPDDADPRGSAFNVNQAQIAIGSGQVAGQGLFRGTQTSLAYVPQNHTDFIFTVVGEELGFFGSSFLLLLFVLLVWRALRIAALSRDTFGMLVAGGVVVVLAFQVFINVGMAVGLMPVTGLPLPFVSYGGTSLIGSFVMVGLLQNVHMRRFG